MDIQTDIAQVGRGESDDFRAIGAGRFTNDYARFINVMSRLYAPSLACSQTRTEGTDMNTRALLLGVVLGSFGGVTTARPQIVDMNQVKAQTYLTQGAHTKQGDALYPISRPSTDADTSLAPYVGGTFIAKYVVKHVGGRLLRGVY